MLRALALPVRGVQLFSIVYISSGGLGGGGHRGRATPQSGDHGMERLGRVLLCHQVCTEFHFDLSRMPPGSFLMRSTELDPE